MPHISGPAISLWHTVLPPDCPIQIPDEPKKAWPASNTRLSATSVPRVSSTSHSQLSGSPILIPPLAASRIVQRAIVLSRQPRAAQFPRGNAGQLARLDPAFVGPVGVDRGRRREFGLDVGQPSAGSVQLVWAKPRSRRIT